MNATKSKLIFHLIAIVTVIIWGTTFCFHQDSHSKWLDSFRDILLPFCFGLYLYVEHLPQEVFCQ